MIGNWVVMSRDPMVMAYPSLAMAYTVMTDPVMANAFAAYEGKTNAVMAHQIISSSLTASDFRFWSGLRDLSLGFRVQGAVRVLA